MYYRVRDLADHWGVSQCTIYRWLSKGVPGSLRPFPYTRMGRGIRWSPAQLEQIEHDMARAGIDPFRHRRKPAS